MWAGKILRWAYKEESKRVDNALEPRADAILIGHVVKRIADYVTRSVRSRANSRLCFECQGVPLDIDVPWWLS